jgi:hypothetical protein
MLARPLTRRENRPVTRLPVLESTIKQLYEDRNHMRVLGFECGFHAATCAPPRIHLMSRMGIMPRPKTRPLNEIAFSMASGVGVPRTSLSVYTVGATAHTSAAIR